MLRAYSDDFVQLWDILDFMIDRSAKANESHESDPAENLPRVCTVVWENAKIFLNKIELVCRKFELDAAIGKISGVRHWFDAIVAAEEPGMFQGFLVRLNSDLTELRRLISHQFDSRMFMYIPIKDAKYLNASPCLFGRAVQDRFQEMAADIEDARLCLGINCSTAAVFHLLCVLEQAIKFLAAKMKIGKTKVEHKEWGKILVAFDARIKIMRPRTSKARSRRDSFSEAVVHLSNVKNAWRNPTMHARRRYNQEEAEAIFENVRTFVSFLADSYL